MGASLILPHSFKVLMEAGTIEHQGIITGIEGKTVKVSLLNVSSCSSCHAKAMCNVSDVDNKEIEVMRNGQDYKLGEKVRLLYQKSMSFKALMLGYLFPFLLVFITLIVTLSITKNEPLSGLISLISLIPYYSVLALFRNKLKRTFTFTLVR